MKKKERTKMEGKKGRQKKEKRNKDRLETMIKGRSSLLSLSARSLCLQSRHGQAYLSAQKEKQHHAARCALCALLLL